MLQQTVGAEPDLTPTLPGRYYFDPTIWALERDRIFSRLWVCVGSGEEIAGVGDYLTTVVGRERIVVARGGDGRARAFLNSCRHRGTTVCEAEHGSGATSFQCRYHAWTYGLDGRLLSGPFLNDLQGFDREDWGLLPVALTEWEGLLWVNLAENPVPLSDQLTPLIVQRLGDYDRFACYHLGELMVRHSIRYDVRANWKIVVENFMECYHCSPVHPELVRAFPAFRAGYTQQPSLGTALAEDYDSFTPTGKTRRPKLPGLPPEHQRQFYGMVLRPNVFLNLTPDYVVIHVLEPVGPDRTRIACHWLFHRDVVKEADFDPSDAVEAFDLVNRQDWDICELQQAGVPSKSFHAGGVYLPHERHIRGFNDFVLRELGHEQEGVPGEG